MVPHSGEAVCCENNISTSLQIREEGEMACVPWGESSRLALRGSRPK